ncbi:MAG: type II toxin-antitoxin system VapC family toxin [Clostridiales bacterium]|nr:type II toxin-antitoxin system VapC family toxin [Clostridiales bacterium]
MKYMLDTNICIYAIKNKPETVIRKLKKTDPKDVCISAVTYAELMHGVEKSQAVERNRLALALLLSNIEIKSFDMSAADEYGKIRATLEKKGEPIGPLDMMIAGHARSLGCVVVTNNTREFSRVKGLKVENWAE